MKVLIVGNYNKGNFSPFITEQIDSLQKKGVYVDTYGIIGKGLLGYLKNVKGIRHKILKFKPDIVHAHYGLSGLCANLQRIVPVITTYHGSDIHSGGWILLLSKIAIWLSKYNIFISKKLLDLSGYKGNNISIIPCGIDMNMIKDIPREEAKRKIGSKEKFVLFASSFSNKVKNFPLAKKAMEFVEGVEIKELNGYTRQEVSLLMNAADCLLMTSDREGSPQVIKEAMACGTPIVSVDVGDVKDIISSTRGCFIANRSPEDIADKVKLALSFNDKTLGRKRIIELGLSNDIVANRLIKIYKQVANIS